MKTRELRVERSPTCSSRFLREPVAGRHPFSAKVILIGEPATIALSLELVDPDFPQLFKIRAEFGPDVVLDADAARSYAAFASASESAAPAPCSTARPSPSCSSTAPASPSETTA
jgi:hypothetical protein